MVHGKRWTFVKHKCRCEACVTANAAYMIAYREKNKAKILAKEQKRYQREKAKIIARMGVYYGDNKEVILERQKTALALARRLKNQKTREARKLGCFVEVVDPLIVHERGGPCGICGKFIVGDYQMDHVWPLSRGGLHSYRNVQLVHPKCNAHKHDRLPTIQELERVDRSLSRS
jgi:5-methylcytosine-specific restriction endonuclease McrA